jgi:hypothetical protein
MPRGMIVMTGEDVVRGQSVQGRSLTIDIVKGDVNIAGLTSAQGHAASGVYASAMSGFLRWLAPHLDEVRNELKLSMPILRTKAAGVAHARTPSIVADLYFGAQVFFRFALESHVLTQEIADNYLDRIWRGLMAAAGAHADHVRESDPIDRFLDLLRSAIGSGAAHFADCDGSVPIGPGALGWRHEEHRAERTWIPRGPCIGWVDGDDLYLNDNAALRVASQVATDGTGVSLPVTILRRRLKERGLLASTGADRGRSTITILKRVAGARLEVLHFARKTIWPEEEIEVVEEISG